MSERPTTTRGQNCSAPDQPKGQEGVNRGKDQHLAWQFLEQHRSDADQKQHKGQGRPPVGFDRIFEAKQHLVPAFGQNRPTCATGALQDFPALRAGYWSSRPRSTSRVDARIDFGNKIDGQNGQDRIDPIREQVFTHPFDRAGLLNGRREGGIGS